MRKSFLVSEPVLPQELSSAAAAVLERAGRLEASEYNRPAWPAQDAPRLTLDTVRLIEPDLTAARLREGSWTDVEVSGGQLAGLDLTGTSLRRVRLLRPRLSGAVLAEAELKDVIIRDAKLDLANFRHATLTRVRFIDCQLTEAAFGGAKLFDVTFTGCDLSSAEFSAANLRQVDFHGSTLTSLQGVAGLRGGTVNADQMIGLLPELAAELGIKLENN